MAAIAFNCPRLKYPALALRQAAPWLQKMSATSSMGRGMAAGGYAVPVASLSAKTQCFGASRTYLIHKASMCIHTQKVIRLTNEIRTGEMRTILVPLPFLYLNSFH